jgi:hypothetical protein
MKKFLMTLCAFAFVVSTAGIAAAGAPAEKDTKAAKGDKPAKEEKAAPAKDEKAAGDKAKK